MKKLLNTDIEIKNIDNIVYVAPGTGKPNHYNRKFHGLCYYMTSDNVFNFKDFVSVKTEENSVVYIPQNSTYTVHSSNDFDKAKGCYAINFTLTNEQRDIPSCLPIQNHSEIENLFFEAEKLWQEKAIGYQMKCKSILYEIFYLLQKQIFKEYAPTSHKNKLQPAIKYIHSNYLTEEIKISHLANLCGISETYLRKLFLETYQMSPIKFINSLKIEHAKELMRSDMYKSIEIISELSGFSDECYFRKIFKQFSSVSPKEYRKAYHKTMQKQ